MASRVEMLVAVMEEFDLHTLAYIGEDEAFEDEFAEKIGERDVSGPGEDPADCVYIDEYSENPIESIRLAYEKVKEGGFLLGSKYLHENLEIMRSISHIFNLMLVQVGPGGTWCIRK